MTRMGLSAAAAICGAILATPAPAAAPQGRLPPLDEAKMSPEQKAAYAKIDAYLDFRGAPGGNFAVWAQQPGMAQGTFELFLAHRYEDRLERRLFELAIVTVARNWSAPFPFTAHSTTARSVGVDPEVVEAIRLGRTPRLIKPDEQATYQLISELTREQKVSQQTYDKAIAVLGPERVIALVNAAGFYAMVSMATVAFETPVMERLGKPVDLPPLNDMPRVAYGAGPPSAKSRLPELNYDTLTPAQQAEVAKIRTYFERPPPGPFQIWSHQPSVARGGFDLFLTQRYQDAAERRLMEVMVLTVARSWGCQLEWPSHVTQAAANGISPEAIEAIRTGATPTFSKPDEHAAYDIVNELTADRKISQATFERATEVLGTPKLIALINGASFYTMACMTEVAFDMPAPARPGAPTPAPLPALAVPRS